MRGKKFFLKFLTLSSRLYTEQKLVFALWEARCKKGIFFTWSVWRTPKFTFLWIYPKTVYVLISAGDFEFFWTYVLTFKTVNKRKIVFFDAKRIFFFIFMFLSHLYILELVISPSYWSSHFCTFFCFFLFFSCNYRQNKLKESFSA